VSMEEQKKRRARRKFTEEFKARAVRLVLKEGQTAAQVARDLDLVESVLHAGRAADRVRISRSVCRAVDASRGRPDGFVQRYGCPTKRRAGP
jgi:transposase-like protein